MKNLRFMLIAAILFTTIGCDKDDEEKTGMAKIAFQGISSAALNAPDDASTKGTPVVLAIKLLAVYLSEGVDANGNNSGKTGIIYLNSECNGDIKNCDVGGATNNISTFFDLARSPTVVNAEINAGAQEIEVGDYNYVRLEFCKSAPADAKNLRFQTTGMSAPTEVLRSSCVASSAMATTPIAVTEGSTVTVDLGYDYSQSQWIYAAGDTSTNGGIDCVVVGDHRECVALPTFTPSASVQ